MGENSNITFIESLRKKGDIDEYLQQSIKHNDVEFEWIYGTKQGNDISKDTFIKLKHGLDKNTSVSALDESNTLDIRCEIKGKHNKSIMGNVRVTLTGIHEIKQYCLQDNFDDLNPSFMKKNMYKDPKHPSKKFTSIESNEYPCRVNVKQETELQYTGPELTNSSPELNVVLKQWQTKNKFFRYKKRYSYISSNKLFRIDLTAIKSSKKKKNSNEYHYSRTFKESNILNEPETFELEIEYIGSVSKTLALPPIYTFEEIATLSPFALDIDEGNCGNVLTPDIAFVNNEETDNLYSLSPRYDEGIEFDEPLDSPVNTPRSLPDKITIKEDYWTETKQEDLYKHIEDNKKRFWNQDWLAKNYIFIPRYKRFIQRDDADLPSGEYVVVDISPSITIEDENISRLTISVDYIIEDLFGYNPETDEYSPESPRLDGGSVKGGSVKGGSATKGGGMFSGIDSKCYTPTMINKVFECLEELIHTCYSIIVNTEYYLDSKIKTDILKQYSELTNETQKHKFKLIGPQPVSMGIEHLNPLNPHSIYSKYVVTEKADGVRAQLVIKDNQGYLLTTKKDVFYTGATFEDCKGDWIFDGEYITQNKKGEDIKLFMIFDVYYSSEFSTQPYTYPWSSKKGESRSQIIHTFQTETSIVYNDVYPDSNVRIGFKQYLDGPGKLTKKKNGDFGNLMNIFKSTKRILDMEDNGFEYFTDGLIFLPMFLSVKGMEEGDIVKSIKGTWSLNYKWKPPEENTIDFKVLFMKDKHRNVVHSYTDTSEDGKVQTKYYQKVQLVVDYREEDDESIDFNWSILTDKPINKQTYQYFDPPTHKKDNIHITNIPLTNKQMICLKDKKDIKNGSIIEMRYNPDSKDGFTWTPLRVRDDKFKPQYFTISNNIWSTINEPITTNMIQGTINFDEVRKEVSTTDKYYVGDKFSEDAPIRDLHNYIKSKLISRVCSSNDHRGKLMIADLSCGRGGDIKKYLSSKNEVEFILGLDISSNVNEAAQRYHYTYKPKPKALFLQYDTSKSIEKQEGCIVSMNKEKQEQCCDMLDMIFGKAKTFHKKYKDIQRRYLGIAKQGFDVVSSQFSLHYYFKDEETLRGFCENIQYLCADKGYFIGTCYDGMKVMKTFAQQDTDTLEMSDEFGSLIYQIKKKYTITDFSYNKEDISDMFGHEIDVFMASIGQPITEYLVNFEFFIDIMKEYGFELSLPTFRKGEYNPIKDPIQSFEQIINGTSEIKDNDDEFIKKTKNTDLYKVHSNKEYSLLSGLNNYFIFQKSS